MTLYNFSGDTATLTKLTLSKDITRTEIDYNLTVQDPNYTANPLTYLIQVLLVFTRYVSMYVSGNLLVKSNAIPVW